MISARDKRLWLWLNRLPIGFDKNLIEVTIKPLNDRVSEIIEERQTPTECGKSIWTADSRSAPAFKEISLKPDFDSFECSIFVAYKGGLYSSFEVSLREFYQDTSSAKL